MFWAVNNLIVIIIIIIINLYNKTTTKETLASTGSGIFLSGLADNSKLLKCPCHASGK